MEMLGAACPPAHLENSEVLPEGSVAVAVIQWLDGTTTGSVTLKDALLPAAATLAAPRTFWPSPKPEGSHCALEKNSRWNCGLAVELSVPLICIELAGRWTLVMTG